MGIPGLQKRAKKEMGGSWELGLFAPILPRTEWKEDPCYRYDGAVVDNIALYPHAPVYTDGSCILPAQTDLARAAYAVWQLDSAGHARQAAGYVPPFAAYSGHRRTHGQLHHQGPIGRRSGALH